VTDRELLELAAKAAGVEYNFICPTGAHCGDINTTQNRFWNPLNDDGDALRLAVKLGIGTDFDFSNGCGETSAAQTLQEYQYENHGDDPYAATRRAIVRAAAEIGKGMK
jgi:hypothetical protein